MPGDPRSVAAYAPMKRGLKMLKLFLILIPVLAIVACGGDDSEEIVGTWKLMSSSKSFTFTFDNDGEFIALEDGSIDSEGTYHVSGNLLHLPSGDTITFVFSIIGNVMTLEAEDEDFSGVFEKL